MPIKLYYNGAVTLYGDPSKRCVEALEKYRDKIKHDNEHESWNALNKHEYEYRKIILDNEYSNKRNYQLKHHNRQSIISSGIYGHDNKKNNVLFTTLTYPASKFTHDDPDKSSNLALKKYLNNLRTNYDLKGYAWVKEYTEIGTPHYHLLADIPYTPIKKLNDIWAKNAGIVSKCCVRSDPEKGLVVKSPEAAGFYVAKYISKIGNNSANIKEFIDKETGEITTKKIGFDKRMYAISNSWQVPTITINDNEQIKEILKNSKNHFEGEFCTTFQIDYKLSKEIYDIKKHNNYIQNELNNLPPII